MAMKPCRICGRMRYVTAKSLSEPTCQSCRRGVAVTPAPPRPARGLVCARCQRPMLPGPGSLPDGQATCRDCRRLKRSERRHAAGELTYSACVGCGRQHRGKYPKCYQCRRPSGWHTAPVQSGDPMSERTEQTRQRAKWRPLVEAGRTYCQQGIPGNGSSGTCVEPTRWIAPGTRWAVGHTDDRTGRIGPVHYRCNLLDACSRGGIAKKAKYGKQRGDGAKTASTDNRRRLAL